MERPISFILACLIVISLTACGADTSSPSSVPSSTPINTSSATTTTSQEPVQTETYPKIRECFSTINENWKIVIYERKNRLEVVLLADDLNHDAAPENWDDILLSLENALIEADPLTSDNGFSMLSAQINVADGTILASGYDKKVRFDLFNAKTTYKESGNGLITLSIFNKLKTGMTYAEVRDLIGADGELTSSVDIGDYQYKTETYTWDGAGDFGANAIIMFQGGGLTSKAQYGLK